MATDANMFAGWPDAHTEGPSFFWQGNNTLKVPRSMHKLTRQSVIKNMLSAGAQESGFAFLQGGVSSCRHDSDHEDVFRQESNFHYLFGVAEPDCFGGVALGSGESVLFIPKLPEVYATWMGPIASKDDFKKKYEVEKVYFVEEIPSFFAELKPSTIYVYSGVNSDSKSEGVPATFDGIDQYSIDKEILHPALYEARVVKNDEEVKILRYANQVSSAAHISVMQKVRPGMMEYQMEADFLHHCYYNGGMRFASYTAICGCGPNASVLHYGHAGAPNNRKLSGEEVTLNDMGCEYYCYASDITCSFPIGGKFSEDQKAIYEAVLDANIRVMKTLAPGVSWVEMHQLAERTIAEHLLRLGFLRGSLEDILAAEVPGVFMPHGLGHLMGIDTHDVGGIPAGAVKYKSLRMNRPLLQGMCLTVEPGCYFIKHLLEGALREEGKAKHLVEDRLRAQLGKFGGVRIEDNMMITETGIELLTNVPRTVREIETVMAGGAFPLTDSDYPIPRPAPLPAAA